MAPGSRSSAGPLMGAGRLYPWVSSPEESGPTGQRWRSSSPRGFGGAGKSDDAAVGGASLVMAFPHRSDCPLGRLSALATSAGAVCDL